MSISSISVFKKPAVAQNEQPIMSVRAGQPVDDSRVPENSFWAVEEPFIVNDAIPRSLSQMTTKEIPHKTTFNVFSSYEEAAAYGQKVNKNLVIMEIRPSATVRPQTALVTKLSEAS